MNSTNWKLQRLQHLLSDVVLISLHFVRLHLIITGMT